MPGLALLQLPEADSFYLCASQPAACLRLSANQLPVSAANNANISNSTSSSCGGSSSYSSSNRGSSGGGSSSSSREALLPFGQ